MTVPAGAAPHGGTGPWVLGVDSGGSGLRVALANAGNGPDDGNGLHTGSGVGAGDSVGAGSSVGARESVGVGPVWNATSRVPVRTGPAGIDAGHLLDQLLPMVRTLLDRAGAGAVSAVAIGAAGMATLGADLRAELPGTLARSLGVRRLALAGDAVTAYAGALGQRPGAVVAAGTGMIALGTDLTGWRRADGWGHLLGDCGGGAWIGRAGLDAAMRAHDGRRGGSPALLARVEAVFGPAPELPALLYPRTDRPAVLASFAPEVARCAAAEPADPVATGILREAARHIADAADAVCPPSGDCEVGLAGGLFKLGDPLLAPLRDELAARLPQARTVMAAGDPLDGAVLIATALTTGGLRLPLDARLLHVPTEQGS
ncbi:BadF/BadG/BcrA/BcrD ATPase family protein [Streptomyces sp. H27-C3]|uniref:N-acetylglucosamine kinase n=1 Tax=Streptomyces sp. H27-C3 TaxID=3046305 RepID=UPI0024BBA3E0|nr:BadF/BadG/BcrA/BcrD ATPase family protein [Streptomyces sp. H27-C3]MDJ0463722.1 BadF/BadG/BcrA/BcrD ATPase family protein [Streptomyces sp. H27-C3]